MKKAVYPHTPPRVLHNIAASIIGLLAKVLWNTKVINSVQETMAPPFLVLVNHQSNIDGFLALHAMVPYHINFVIGKYHFRRKAERWIFRLIGAIPKEQFIPDVSAIIEMRRVIARNGILAIFPAGQSCISGESTPLPSGLSKLIKYLDVPVYSLHISGSHLTYPKWDMSHFRRGEITITKKLLFSRDSVRKLGKNELLSIAQDDLYFDEYVYQKEKKLQIITKTPAKGLTSLFFLCLECNSLFTLQEAKSYIICKKCGSVFYCDQFGFMHKANLANTPISPSDWNRQQQNALYNTILQNRDFEMRAEATVSVLNQKGKSDPLVSGVLKFVLYSLIMLDANSTVVLEIPIAGHSLLPHENPYTFEIAERSSTYQIRFTQRGIAYAFVSAVYQASRQLENQATC